MPAPIPAPPGDFSSATKHYSPTSTINYPTHLTVTTTSSSRVNGDWGFKRPFPLKTTTNTTYPLVRVRQVDSTEHVTDFQSASDHTMTLQKYQELNLPISVPPAKNTYELYSSAKYPTSVFEEDSDITALDSEQRVKLANKRWKFTGPWLAGMTDGDFNRFLDKTVRGKRAEFRAFLKEHLATELTEDRAQKAREAGEAEEPAAISASEITESQFIDYLRELRQERMTLYNLVSRFLDLAPITLASELEWMHRWPPGKARTLDRGSRYGADGPPITHPSAGLSYLRTRSFNENHAVYGAQKHHLPVEARVLKPTSTSTHSFKPSIGVAGFVAVNPANDSVFNQKQSWNVSDIGKRLHKIDLDKYGGSKIYVQPTLATVGSSGSINVNIEQVNLESEAVQKELVGEGTVFEQELKGIEKPAVPLNPRGTPRPLGNRFTSSARSYGLGL
ncbi:hypothetical protein M426DRAFT_321900 [Hypoxylon sp. CI-4A]|nr:hypothetical protein M426DRAFT_321900 [Hypoxylon sp. CI-4A]